jgi:hypothetical protein
LINQNCLSVSLGVDSPLPHPQVLTLLFGLFGAAGVWLGKACDVVQHSVGQGLLLLGASCGMVAVVVRDRQGSLVIRDDSASGVNLIILFAVKLTIY